MNSYKSLNQLYDVIEKFADVPDSELQTKAEKTAEVKKGSEVFFDGPGLKVIIPKTEEAACLYGAGTKWCTAAKDNNMFKHYHDQGPLMIIMAEIGDKQRKFQLHYESDSYMDERDQAISEKDKTALSKNPSYNEFINKLIEKHYTPYLDTGK